MSSKYSRVVDIGKMGGLKRGKARSEKFTEEQIKAIAKKAADKRWHKT